MKPYLHALSSAKKFKGVAADYQDIHDFMDSSKSAFPDNRHRAIFHTDFGCFVVEKVFGITRTNSDGKVYSVRDIAEMHIQEDNNGIIPSVSDYLSEMESKPWMNGVKNEVPPSHQKIAAKRTTTFTPFKERD